jgi:hypothetical protein
VEGESSKETSVDRDLSVKGGTSERCYRTRRGRTDEQRYAIISPYVDGCIQMNGPYLEITNILVSGPDILVKPN